MLAAIVHIAYVYYIYNANQPVVGWLGGQWYPLSTRVQVAGGAHRGRMCVCALVEVSVCLCMCATLIVPC